MQSSANTFGTFLQTFRTIDDKNLEPRLAEESSQDILGLVEMAKTIQNLGGRPDVAMLSQASALNRDQLLTVLLKAKQQGLIELTEDKGGTLANLTGVGKLLLP